MDQHDFRSAARARYDAMLREVEDDLATLRGARERMVAAGVAAQIHVEKVTGRTISDTSDDGAATVICDGLGKVQQVTVDEAMYDRIDEQQVCDAVMQAHHRARELARQMRAMSGGDHATTR